MFIIFRTSGNCDDLALETGAAEIAESLEEEGNNMSPAESLQAEEASPALQTPNVKRRCGSVRGGKRGGSSGGEATISPISKELLQSLRSNAEDEDDHFFKGLCLSFKKLSPPLKRQCRRQLLDAMSSFEEQNEGFTSGNTGGFNIRDAMETYNNSY